MKQLYIVLFIWCFCGITSNAQSYLPIAKDSTIWFYELDPTIFAPVDRYILYTGGDTIIENMTYQKLFFRTDKNTQSKLVAAIRDDIQLQEVYAYLFTHQLTTGLTLSTNCPLESSIILYDFSLKPTEILSNTCQQTGTVSDTTRSFIYNKNRKTITLDDIGQTWYEGIGSITGLFNGLVAASGYSLSNYCEGSFEECSVELFLDTDFIPLNKSGKIFPNPAFSQFTLTLSKDIYDAQIIFSDIYGQKIGGTNINGNDEVFDISHLANGIYFVEMTKEGRTIFKDKLVVAR
ncbi:MAG: T9SS type A sorting domain-containing protein [Saprospiraceae bacterium]